MYIPKKTNVSRSEKIRKELHRFISEYLIKGSFFTQLKHPPMITIANVDLTPNMRHAIIYFENFDQNPRDDVLNFLNTIAKDLSREWAKTSTTKYSPSFEFRPSLSGENRERLQKIFDKLKT